MYTTRVKLPADINDADAMKFSGHLSESGHAVSLLRENNRRDGAWILEWITQTPPDKKSLIANVDEAAFGIAVAEIDLSVEKIPENTDWLARSYKQFPPFSIGPFFIYGSHFEDAVPDGQMGLQIDAATAFGSGEHGTTKGCLTAMLDLKGQGACPWNVLDMGTGSGILGVAAFKLWKTPVLAIDNDVEAVRVACHHREINKIPPGATGFLCKQGDGFSAAIVQERKPFDLIIANILAGPLQVMAEDLTKVSDTNGYVILSGILNEQAEDILAAYESFKLRRRYDIGEWSTLVLQNAN